MCLLTGKPILLSLVFGLWAGVSEQPEPQVGVLPGAGGQGAGGGGLLLGGHG